MLVKWKLSVDNNEAFRNSINRFFTFLRLSKLWPTYCKNAFSWFIINISKIDKWLFIKSQTRNKVWKGFFVNEKHWHWFTVRIIIWPTFIQCFCLNIVFNSLQYLLCKLYWSQHPLHYQPKYRLCEQVTGGVIYPTFKLV